MWCVRKNEKNTSVRRKTIESSVVFLSSFFVSVLSEKTQSKNESIRVRQNKYIFSVYRPFSTIFENLAKRDKFWPDQGSNPGPQDYEPYHIPTAPTDQVTTYQFYLNIVTDVQSVCLQSTHKYKWKIFAGIFDCVYIWYFVCERSIWESVCGVLCSIKTCHKTIVKRL